MGRIKRVIENSLKKLNVRKYLVYALGEVILIVIGVLIAVNINNYNDNRNKKEKLKVVLENISQDLNSDIANLDFLIEGYEKLDSLIVKIVEEQYTQDYFDSINEENYTDCSPCFAHHAGFQTFAAKLDGYNQLKDFSPGSIDVRAQLSQDLLFFYEENLNTNSLLEKMLANTVMKNIESLEQFDWYSAYMLGKYNPKAIQYFQNDITYRNKLVTFQLVAIENHSALLKEYREKAKEFLKRIKN